MVDKLIQALDLIAIAVIFATVRSFFSPSRQGFYGYVVSSVTAVTVGTLGGFVLSSMGLAEHWIYVGVAVATLVGENLVVATLSLGRTVEADPIAFVRSLRNLFSTDKK